MPPRTRTRKAKALKENADVENNFNSAGKVIKSNRKVLGDKTNSLSDDNETVKETKQVPTKLSLAIENNGRPRRQKRLPARYKENRVLVNLSTSQNDLNTKTTRKDDTSNIVDNKEIVQEINDRQVPKPKNTDLKYKNANSSTTNALENSDGNIASRSRTRSQNSSRSLTTVSISKNVKVVPSKKGKTIIGKSKIPEQTKQKDTKTKPKDKEPIVLDTKSPNKSRNSGLLHTSTTFTPPSSKTFIAKVEKSLIMNRPKRMHRLPSRFDDHSISPNKFIPVQPCHASTPLPNKPLVNRTQSKQSCKVNNNGDFSKVDKKSNNISPDSNNNPKRVRTARLKMKPKTSPTKSPPTNLKTGKRLLDKSLSFKILDDNKKSKAGGKKQDVYEFTFDPDEEPQPQKKKKKRVVKKKTNKPTVVSKKNYDKNMSKAIAALKEVVAQYQNRKELTSDKDKQSEKIQSVPIASSSNKDGNAVQYKQTILNGMPQNENIDPKVSQGMQNTQQNVADFEAIKQLVNNGNKSVYENPPSISVDDIEADVDRSYHDDINYSPVNSPRPSSLNPVAVTQYLNPEDRRETIQKAIYNNDPLNLQDDISFFDDQPVASSSMNVSIRHPLASPWRVEFGSLPIKWPANTYLKANMTPAVESSFISSEDSNKKKHVYVNMIPQSNESLPQIVENNTTNLKQTSIISFIKEVAERNANKKKRGKSVSPMKASTLFQDITNKTNFDMQSKSKKVTKNVAIEEIANKDKSNSSSNTSNDKENVRETRKRKTNDAISKLPAKSPRKGKDKNVTYFGFDDSEDHDVENVAPNKNIDHNKVRALRSRSKVLQEMNGENRPARAALVPLAAKTKITPSSEAVEKMYDNLKSAEDAPQFSDENDQQNAGTTNLNITQDANIDNEECDSVHLFEDIDVVHHLKPTRKSYGKAKKVTFRQRSNSDSDRQASDVENMQSSDEDDLGDLTFTMPEVNQKKPVKKKKTKKTMSKKEEKEAEEWAAGFNSMCEDIDEFPLVVE